MTFRNGPTARCHPYLENDLPDFFGDPYFFGRYVRYVSYQLSYLIN